MGRAKGPKGPDIRDVQPTIVVLDFKLTINGGTLSSPEVGRVWAALRHALKKSAHACGLGFSYTCELSCTTPKRLRARIERSKLFVEQPAAAEGAD